MSKKRNISEAFTEAIDKKKYGYDLTLEPHLKKVFQKRQKMDKICTNCGNEFEAKRKDTKFCSSKCKMAYSRNVTRNVTDSNQSVTDSVRNVTESQNVTDNSRNVTTDSAINEANVTKVTSAHRKNKSDNVTDKPDSETRDWLIKQFQAEDKTTEQIKDIMIAQDTYYLTRQHYFIPARMLALRATSE